MIVSRRAGRKVFRIEGVVVSFHGQSKPIRAKRLPLHIITPKQMMQPGFQPFRLVINLKLVEAADPQKAVTDFKPPIEIRVHYTAADFQTAKDAGGSICLGYWDGNTWTRCETRLDSRGSPNKGGWLVTTIASWADPTVAVGT
jgi:hypothetical protein